MHATPPRPAPAPSSPTTCQWKRGRPFTASSTRIRDMHHNSGPTTHSSPPLKQPTTSNGATTTENKPSPLQAFAAPSRVGLWDPSYGLRFATTSQAETRQSAPVPPSTKPLPKTEARSSESPSTKDDSTHSGSDLGQDTQYSTEDGACPAGSQSSYRVESTEELDSTDTYEVSSQDESEPDVSEEEESDASEDLAYQIPEDTLRAAMLASPKTRASYWSAKLYQSPDGESLSIHYCKSFDVAERVAQYFLKEKVVGFDIEWKPYGNPHAIKQNASLIQLACEDRIALFHISLFSGYKVEQLMPPSLKAVLESLDVIKVGVAIKGDFKRVEKYLGVRPQGVFELSRLHNLVEWHEVDPSKISNRLVSLATQVLQHLQLPLYKGEQLEDDEDTTSSVRESDWSLPLNLQQIHYAAADAYAGFRLYHILERKRTRLTPTPPPVMLCDYDNKPAPRAKKPRKKAGATAKVKEAIDSDSNLSTDPAEEEQDSDENTQGYETAPEELMDSHELEDPTHTTTHPLKKDKNLGARQAENTELVEDSNLESENETSSSFRRVGRINILSLNGADVGYPVLPQLSQEDTEASQPNEVSADTDDEYADAELEEALGHMTLDDAGNLREDVEVVTPEQTGSSYGLATEWAQNFAQSTIPLPESPAPPRIHATVSHLRAYHLWHHQRMSVDEIAPLVQNPPLSHSTVSNYILQAVTLEKLEYEQDLLKRLILDMPSGMRKGRWKGLAEKVGALG
ncbi:hypothetical protein COCSADRAFT_162487 [Bipolaris sorokiniana ND90Pr]|uniref:3'-5' exonuclease domain-containing protein n=1 Tax=Cochliobolus sativus (strain ND90Pr / ATCC 201652) TaxID=665912 RepID=M2R424_COCSN|nr:uncharacterized protein COCSADRAFT_162487 [Bipolaris sorokiniana ND90Pr]EMD61959.1 hypothetical protein COCSADRAFT_162487 [Bipolaris sorokiniana ND90Pr]